MSEQPQPETLPPAKACPLVAIVGRPNVGKSALFNKIVGRRVAIVHEQAGVTRDRLTAVAHHAERRFMLMDTGGLGLYADERKGATVWDELIRRQLEVAIASADRVILVVDVSHGVHPLDAEVARLLREAGKPTVVAANKADNADLAAQAVEFSELAFETIVPTSCTHTRGIRELLDAVTRDFPAAGAAGVTEPAVRLAVVGRPNVGKSSIVNRLVGEERVIVSEIPGTTRDAIAVPFTLRRGDRSAAAELVDTAGLRRKSRIDSVVEFFSSARAHDAIARADIVLMILEAPTPPTSQDRAICHQIVEAGKGCVLVVNKWDVVSGQIKQQELLAELRRLLPFMDHTEAVACCARSGYNFDRLLAAVFELVDQLAQTYPTSLVNRVIQDAVLRLPPPAGATGVFKIYYGLCTNTRPPTFRLFVNHEQRCPTNYRQYLAHYFQRSFGIRGVPVTIQLRERPQEELPRRDTANRPPAAGGGRRAPSPYAKPSRGRPHGPEPRARGRHGQSAHAQPWRQESAGPEPPARRRHGQSAHAQPWRQESAGPKPQARGRRGQSPHAQPWRQESAGPEPQSRGRRGQAPHAQPSRRRTHGPKPQSRGRRGQSPHALPSRRRTHGPERQARGRRGPAPRRRR